MMSLISIKFPDNSKTELTAIIFYRINRISLAAIIIMVEFSDLFDDESDVFQKKAKVCLSKQAVIRGTWLGR